MLEHNNRNFPTAPKLEIIYICPWSAKEGTSLPFITGDIKCPVKSDFKMTSPSKINLLHLWQE